MADTTQVRKLAFTVSQLSQYPVQSMGAVKAYIDTGWIVDSLKFDNNAWEWTFIKGQAARRVSTIAHQIIEEAIAAAHTGIKALGWAYNRKMTYVYQWYNDGTATRLPIKVVNGAVYIIPITPECVPNSHYSNSWYHELHLFREVL